MNDSWSQPAAAPNNRGRTEVLKNLGSTPIKFMYRHLKYVAVTMLCGLLVDTAFAASAPETSELTLTAEQQAEILSEFSVVLKTNYVVPQNAKAYIEALDQAVANGHFSAALGIDEFISQANKLIQETHSDKHLRLLTPEKYDQVMEMFYGEQGDDETAQPAGHVANEHTTRQRASAGSLKSIGVGRVSEISRDGLNQIAYLELERFDASARSVNFINRVFSTFSESDGVIIDLRICGGGEGEMVRILSSFFFAEPTHLLSSSLQVDAYGNRPLVERWTIPNELSDYFADKPLIILISEKTFSAAESFAFGMQAVGRAELVGETTGGGGYMNDFFALPYSLGASVSVGRTFDHRTGKDWQGIGVLPDLQVASDHALKTALDIFSEESGKLANLTGEELAIYKQIQAFTNAWYEAAPQIMEQLLTDNFLSIYEAADGAEIARITHAQLVQQTADGKGTATNRIYHNRIIRDIKIDKTTATLTLILRETVHQMELQKSAGIWKIKKDTYRDKVRG